MSPRAPESQIRSRQRSLPFLLRLLIVPAAMGIGVNGLASQAPQISVTPTSLTFSAAQYATGPVQQIRVTNSGSGDLCWHGFLDFPFFSVNEVLNISPFYGRLAAGQSVMINASMHSTHRDPGTYQRRVRFENDTLYNSCPQAASNTVLVDVTLTITPPVSSSTDLTVSRTEVVQVVQDQLSSLPLIADKSAVARVFVKIGDGPVSPVSGVTASLRGFRAGTELASSPLQPFNGPITAPNVPQRDNINHSLNFLLPADWTSLGPLTLRAEVNPNRTVTESRTDNNILNTDFVFVQSRTLDIAFFKVCSPTAAQCPSAAVSLGYTMLRKLFPIGDEKVLYRPLSVPKWIWGKPMATKNDQSLFKAALRKRYDLTGPIDGKVPDQLAAWFPPLAGVGTIGSSDPKWLGGAGHVTWLQDTSASDPPGTPADESDVSHSLAHEIGHNLGLRHTNTADGCGATDANTDWPSASAKIGEIGFHPLRRQVIPATKFDLMSYCTPPGSNIWISPFHYLKLHVNSNLAGATAAESESSSAEGEAPSAEYLIVSGWARRDGSAGRLDPVYRVTSALPADPSNSSGNHCIRSSGASGALADYCFTLSFEDPEGNGWIDQESFSLKVPYSAGTSRIALRRASQELAVLAVSANAPSLTITSPRAGDRWTGTQTIAWTASDSDGNPLTYAILYSSDGGNAWLPMDVDVQSPQFALDTAEISGGSQVYFRVLASDGLNTATSTVGPIDVPIPGSGAPAIEVSPTSVAFGTVALGQTKDLNLTVRNTGNGPLTVSAAAASNPQFTVVSPSIPFTVAAAGQQTMTVRFRPSAAAIVSAALTLGSDATNQPTLSVPLTGSGPSNQGNETLASDDGTSETGGLQSGAITVNRVTPSRYPAVLQTIRIFFQQFQGLPSPGGGQIRLVAFGESSGRGTPPANPQLSLNQTATIPSVPAAGAWVDFPIAGGPSITSGDFYVGFQAPSPAGGVVFSADANGAQQRRAFFSSDNGATYVPFALRDAQGNVTNPNVLIRAVVATGTSCNFTLSTSSASLPIAGGSGSVPVTAAAGCPWGAISNASWVTIASGASGSGNGTVGYSVAPNSGGPARTAVLSIAGQGFTVTQAGTLPTTQTLPVVASTPGSLGSFFKTAVQMHNPGTGVISGRFVFHRQGLAGSSSDPALSYSLAPGQTQSVADLLPAMSQSGLGSVDLVATSGALPLLLARMFNDAGSLGTTGMTEELMKPEDALSTGSSGTLIAPANPAVARLNIGVRTLDSGASMTLTVRNKDGAVLKTLTKSYGPIYFAQVAASDFLGMTLSGSDTIRVSMNSGSAIVYGVVADNTTQDPSLQIIRRAP